jgi:hypothetical protein
MRPLLDPGGIPQGEICGVGDFGINTRQKAVKWKRSSIKESIVIGQQKKKTLNFMVGAALEGNT